MGSSLPRNSPKISIQEWGFFSKIQILELTLCAPLNRGWTAAKGFSVQLASRLRATSALFAELESQGTPKSH